MDKVDRVKAVPIAVSRVTNSLVWFRRDLRCYDHAALYHALKHSQNTYCVFVFDTTILDCLKPDDRRIAFILECVLALDRELQSLGGNLLILHGDPRKEIPDLVTRMAIDAVFVNH
ncbi:MAG: deoxyribodipyrimidine photo-lyase, partial [Undibacterium sp.]|nr:deoxyribodipyrimidine photo-lyase [Undibacterium sp.]